MTELVTILMDIVALRLDNAFALMTMQALLAQVTSLIKLYLHFIYIIFAFKNIAICAFPSYYNSSLCIDQNNILECNYDGGDCCQENPGADWDARFQCKKTLP